MRQRTRLKKNAPPGGEQRVKRREYDGGVQNRGGGGDQLLKQQRHVLKRGVPARQKRIGTPSETKEEGIPCEKGRWPGKGGRTTPIRVEKEVTG